MTPLHVSRDDGPIATWLGRAVGGRVRAGAVALTLAGALAPVAVFVVPARSLSAATAGVAAAVFVLLAGAASARTGGGRFAWAVTPVLRLVEYGLLIKLTAIVDDGALPACYALLAALAFHHYDTVYRLRHQGAAPPAWTRAGGWDGRLLVAVVLAVTGGLPAGLVAGAIALGALWVAESVRSWLRFTGGGTADLRAAEEPGEA